MRDTAYQAKRIGDKEMNSDKVLKQCTNFENIEVENLSTSQLIVVERTAYNKFKEAEKERWERESARSN